MMSVKWAGREMRFETMAMMKLVMLNIGDINNNNDLKKKWMRRTT